MPKTNHCLSWLVWALLCVGSLVDGRSEALVGGAVQSTPDGFNTENRVVPIITRIVRNMFQQYSSVFLPNKQQPESPLSTGILSTTKSIGIDTPIATDRARPADPLSHNTGDDASSKVRAIFFEVVGACIGIATLFIAILALKRMPKRKNPDLESPPLGCNHHRGLQHGVAERTPNQGEPVELDAVQTAVEMQCEEPAILNFSVQATQHPSSITTATG